jgi:hypothetical protein
MKPLLCLRRTSWSCITAVDVALHAFYIWILDGDEWSLLRQKRFSFVELYTRLIGPQSYSSVVAKIMSTLVTNQISVLVDSLLGPVLSTQELILQKNLSMGKPCQNNLIFVYRNGGDGNKPRHKSLYKYAKRNCSRPLYIIHVTNIMFLDIIHRPFLDDVWDKTGRWITLSCLYFKI